MALKMEWPAAPRTHNGGTATCSLNVAVGRAQWANTAVWNLEPAESRRDSAAGLYRRGEAGIDADCRISSGIGGPHAELVGRRSRKAAQCGAMDRDESRVNRCLPAVRRRCAILNLGCCRPIRRPRD